MSASHEVTSEGYNVLESPEPPISTSSLRDLDFGLIIQNPHFRHEINFVPDLIFSPILDGDQGRRRREKARSFWHALSNDLVMFVNDRARFHLEYGQNANWTFVRLFNSVKEITKMLVPSSDHTALDEVLDVEYFMQTLYKGMADLDALSSRLGGFLKLHCAPMRDEMVDKACKQISNGNANDDIQGIVNGLADLLSLLEFMKLDAVNHEIRTARYTLIENTVSFEQQFFRQRIAAGEIDISHSRDWYENAIQGTTGQFTYQATQDFGDMGMLLGALASYLLPGNDTEPLPAIFQLDTGQIAKLRNDMYDAVFLEGCLQQYDLLKDGQHISGPSGDVLSQLGSLDREGIFNFPLAEQHVAVDYSPSSQVLITRLRHSWQPSPLVIPPPGPFLYMQPLQMNIWTKRRELHSALINILQSVPSKPHVVDRWHAVSPGMAFEVFRATNLPPELFPQVEETIINNILQKDFLKLQALKQYMLERLMERLRDRVRQYRGLSGAVLSQRTASELKFDLHEAFGDSGVENIAIILAHTGIIHWRVWADLIYLN